MADSLKAPRRLIFFVTEDWYFCSHRLPLAVAAREAGYEVAVLTRVNQHADVIRNAGLRLISLNIERRGFNPLAELRVLWQVWRVYRAEKPDVVHHVAIKPVLYGSLAARLAGVKGVVNALGGLGLIFSAQTRFARLIRPPVMLAFRWLLDGARQRVILQNPENRALLIKAGAVSEDHTVLIRGAGVDLSLFSPQPAPAGTPRVALVSRMLWAKGVGDFVEAARSLKARGVQAEFALIGSPDEENPDAIPLDVLRAWHTEGLVNYMGRQQNVAALLAHSHIVCLPSAYGEGVPLALLEAAAAGRAIVTTDAPGCREVVRHGENGLLVPVHDVAALAAALQQLIEDAPLRERMGQAGRAIAAGEFSQESVIERCLAVYDKVLAQ